MNNEPIEKILEAFREKMEPEFSQDEFPPLSNGKPRCNGDCTGEWHFVFGKDGKELGVIRCPVDMGKIKDSRKDFVKKKIQDGYGTLEKWIPINDDKKYRNLAIDIIKHPEKRNYIFVSEKSGTGKTHLAQGIYLKLIMQRNLKRVGFAVCSKIRRLLAYHEDGTHERIINFLKTDNFLILDDLGAGRQKGLEYFTEMLSEVIEERNRKKLRWIVTTNLIGNELNSTLGQRLSNRLMEDCTIVEFNNISQRTKSTVFWGNQKVKPKKEYKITRSKIEDEDIPF